MGEGEGGTLNLLHSRLGLTGTGRVVGTPFRIGMPPHNEIIVPKDCSSLYMCKRDKVFRHKDHLVFQVHSQEQLW